MPDSRKRARSKQPRGSYLTWRRQHWPLFDALERGDMAEFRAVADHYAAVNEMLAERALFCIYCHAPMIHIVSGFYYCPYQRAKVHERARRALLL